MSQVATAADWAPYIGVSLSRRLFSFARSAWIMFVVDNPLMWKWGFRGKYANDDIEGPFYVVGAPQRQVEEGKMVLASADALHKHGPFLFSIEVKDAKGEPVPNAVLDCWQADSDGVYFFASWTLRGKMMTDAQGHAEILTVRPADYGAPMLGRRAGHLHIMVTGTTGKHAPMTSQIYVCPGNNAEHLSIDFANAWRQTPRQNMATCWSVPAATGGERMHNLPELPASDTGTIERLAWWNQKLHEHGIDREVGAVGCHEIRLGDI
ncbi:Intradiol ring-cleavage dioxygenase [Daedaleopsis nitida]|nr:Intradiol ring-cleavage dioxygenase [Daedaleopsis nitida]